MLHMQHVQRYGKMFHGQTLKSATSDYDQHHVIAFRPISVAAGHTTNLNVPLATVHRLYTVLGQTGGDFHRSADVIPSDANSRHLWTWTMAGPMPVCRMLTKV